MEFLTIEVGSTITKLNGFNRHPDGGFQHVAQGFAPTSIAQGDVGIGVEEAKADLLSRYGDVGQPETYVNSSAAGGLRMTVHGLTYSMTARAAKEAALGAGAIIKMVTAGELDTYDLQEMESIQPNIILLAGGVDFGEKSTVLKNAERIAAQPLHAPVVYAGNVVLRKPIQALFQAAGRELLLADNVFPDVDVLNVEPLRRVIHEVFNRHIIHAPGMAKFAELTPWGILPTPGAVLKGATLFADALGDCLVVDVGGATTDVHSVSEGSPEWTARMVEPEPRAKRTVEGDLGVFVNAKNIVELAANPEWEAQLSDIQAMPATDSQKALTRALCRFAVELGVRRHAGQVSDLYTPSGKKQIVKGKDLSSVKWVIGTGGALTRIEGGETILSAICLGPGKHLLPDPQATILLDKHYLFSALGTLAQRHEEAVKRTFQRWVREQQEKHI